MNIGIDFGSTYTTVSTYRSETGMPETLRIDSTMPDSIPSIVCIDRDTNVVTVGFHAREEISSDNTYVAVYKAFKMLLVENNADELQKHGYDAENTPRAIATKFLRSVLMGIQRNHLEQGEKFETVYICVPEVWASRIRALDGHLSRTLDGRQILRDILINDLGELIEYREKHENICVVTEPEAASAFFAHNYEKETQKPFNGHLLLIDYGGGTLDLTLTEVRSSGNGRMEITRRANGGAGENHRDSNGHFQIGNAGIAFQRAILEQVFIDAGIWTKENQPGKNSIEFATAEKKIEQILKNPDNQIHIEQNFGGYGSYQEIGIIMDDEPLLFPTNEHPEKINFMNKRCNLTYQHLYKAYKDTIEKVLYAETKRICKSTASLLGFDPCQPEAGTNERFKIALVGGFGSFYLVQKQIAEIFQLITDTNLDLRVRNMATNKRELAISLGASLLAEGQVELRKTARFSIGIVSSTLNQQLSVHYGITCDQDLEAGEPYFIMHNDKQHRQPYGGSIYTYIKEFAVEDTTNLEHAYLMPIKPELQRRLAEVPDEGFWNIGFSISKEDIIKIHFEHANDQRPPIIIPLESYAELFELSEPREVKFQNGKWHYV